MIPQKCLQSVSDIPDISSHFQPFPAILGQASTATSSHSKPFQAILAKSIPYFIISYCHNFHIQYFSISLFQQFSTSAFQHFSISALQHINHQHFSIAFQFISILALNHSAVNYFINSSFQHFKILGISTSAIQNFRFFRISAFLVFQYFRISAFQHFIGRCLFRQMKGKGTLVSCQCCDQRTTTF